jgi:pyrroline-5-carboxylate reductase
MKATLFLGAGRITSALAAGLRLAGDRRRIMVYDRHPEKLRALRRESQVEIAGALTSAVEQAEMLLVAVRPASVKELLSAVATCGAAPPGLCVSLAAGVPLGNLRAWLGQPARWVRAMPSPVCRIDRGLTGLCFESRVSASQRKRVGKLFEQVGAVVEIPEKLLDVFTVAYSPSHGYHALSRLAKAAQDAGLDRATALTAAAHALSDGILYCREAGLSLDELLHEAATPGGTAAATMAGMDQAGYARVVASGLKAGIRQARTGGKG